MNVDWVTLLLIFIFFILPVFQQIAEARKRKSPLPEDDEAPEGWIPMELPPGEGERGANPLPTNGGEWSSDWGRWPGQPEAPMPADAAPSPSPAMDPTGEGDQERGWRPSKVAGSPRPQLESRGQAGGRERTHRPEAAERPQPKPPVLAPRPVPLALEELDRGRVERAPVRRPPPHRRTAGLTVQRLALTGSNEQLRRAILLTEILGAPLSVRERDGGLGR